MSTTDTSGKHRDTNHQGEVRDINQLRNRLIDLAIIVLGILVLPALVASLLEVRDYGWSISRYSYIGSTAVLFLLLGFRNRLPFRLKSWTIILILIYLATVLAFRNGILGTGLVFFMMAVVMTALLFGTKYAAYVIGFCILSLSVAGALIVSGLVSTSVDYDLYNVNAISWISDITLFLLFCGVIIFTAGRIYQALSNNILILNERNCLLEKARNEAESANRAKSEFLTNISHEVRTPLNSINGHADLVAANVSDSVNRGYLETIKTSTGDLLDLVNRILLLSELETGRTNVLNSNINLATFIRELSDEFREKAKEKGLNFVTEISPPALTTLRLDPEKLKTALSELIDNAIRFTDQGEVRIECGVRSGREAAISELTISVTDTGIGMSEDYLRTRNALFSQADGRISRQFEGIGIGLNLALRLIEAMGGAMTIDSKLNEGTRIEIHFTEIESDYATNTPIPKEPADNDHLDKPGDPIFKDQIHPTPERKERITGALKLLEGDLHLLWEDLQEQQPMEEVEKFAKQIIGAGEDADLKLLVDFGQSLLDAVASFDVDKVIQLLGKYRMLTDQIRQTIAKSN